MQQYLPQRIILHLISGWWSGIGCGAKGGTIIAGQGCGGSTSSTDKAWKEPLKVKAGREPALWWNTLHPHKTMQFKQPCHVPNGFAASECMKVIHGNLCVHFLQFACHVLVVMMVYPEAQGFQDSSFVIRVHP